MKAFLRVFAVVNDRGYWRVTELKEIGGKTVSSLWPVPPFGSEEEAQKKAAELNRKYGRE